MSPNYHLAVLSDLHGNLPAFEAVMADIRQGPPPDAILVAGDFTAGPGQQAILQRLIESQAVMVQGNGEQGITRLANGTAPQAYLTASQFSLFRWTYEHLSPEQREFICALPEQRAFSLPDSAAIRIVHGSPRKVDELVLPDPAVQPHLAHRITRLEDVIDLAPEPVVIFGHTHLPWQTVCQGKLALNPGAVHFPSNHYLGAQYATLDWNGAAWIPTFHQVTYDMQRLQQDYQESGFLDCSPLARAILKSIQTGIDYLPIYFTHLRNVSVELGCPPGSYFPDDVWERAAATFPWG